MKLIKVLQHYESNEKISKIKDQLHYHCRVFPLNFNIYILLLICSYIQGNGILILYSIKNLPSKMQKIPQILIESASRQFSKEVQMIKITITAQNITNNYQAYIEEKQIVFKNKQKIYTLNAMSRMEPRYDSSAKIQSIVIYFNNQEIKITAKNVDILYRVYLQLKRQISHKGFNDYFKPLKRLGKGSFATVYLVQHKITGEKLAAKVFSRESQKIGYMGYEALINEIRILKNLNHPNIIRFDGIYQTENLIYLVTEYLSGGTLAQFMRNKSTLLGDFITKIISDSLESLKYLQQKGIMHRDFKPQNIIMRQSDEKWVLVDFGLAAYSNQKLLYNKCGTMGYIAPEILDQNEQKKLYNSSCDIYSLGVVAYNLMVGCLPFKVEGGMLDRKMVWDAFTKPQSVGLELQILELLKGLLEKDPLKRLTPAQALNSRFFVDPKVVEKWKIFNNNRIEETYNRVLKLRN